jgi:hypothetical protein
VFRVFFFNRKFGDIMSNVDSIKKHFKKNKVVYISTACGVGVGLVAGVLISKNVVNKTTVAEMKNVVAWKPTQITKQVIEVTIEALGDPGNVVQDLTTGTVYASQGQAARALGVYPSDMSKHLAGKKPHINGHIFEKLGKAIVSEAS